MSSATDPSAGSAAEKETGRLEAFSDGVMAVIITIMVLELKPPSGTSFGDLRDRIPALLIYVLSFTFVGIYWNNHHHLLRATSRISPAVMWTNLHLLFWLSLIPVVTEWVGQASGAAAPAAMYSLVSLCDALAYTLLTWAIVRTEGHESRIAAALGRDLKGRLSVLVYVVATPLAFVSPYLTYGLLVAVAVMWFVPDRRLAS
ncbi:MAG TPA: TMEM175 family protein [Candidatus Dormibacteraeota bacterium]|jgi:uncharacterized membrane protein|nr:TMEM175 family protein [Candidatus Dormibacteraeota bacterium]